MLGDPSPDLAAVPHLALLQLDQRYGERRLRRDLVAALPADVAEQQPDLMRTEQIQSHATSLGARQPSREAEQHATHTDNPERRIKRTTKTKKGGAQNNPKRPTRLQNHSCG